MPGRGRCWRGERVRGGGRQPRRRGGQHTRRGPGARFFFPSLSSLRPPLTLPHAHLARPVLEEDEADHGGGGRACARSRVCVCHPRLCGSSKGREGGRGRAPTSEWGGGAPTPLALTRFCFARDFATPPPSPLSKTLPPLSHKASPAMVKVRLTCPVDVEGIEGRAGCRECAGRGARAQASRHSPPADRLRPFFFAFPACPAPAPAPRLPRAVAARSDAEGYLLAACRGGQMAPGRGACPLLLMKKGARPDPVSLATTALSPRTHLPPRSLPTPSPPTVHHRPDSGPDGQAVQHPGALF